MQLFYFWGGRGHVVAHLNVFACLLWLASQINQYTRYLFLEMSLALAVSCFAHGDIAISPAVVVMSVSFFMFCSHSFMSVFVYTVRLCLCLYVYLCYISFVCSMLFILQCLFIQHSFCVISIFLCLFCAYQFSSIEYVEMAVVTVVIAVVTYCIPACPILCFGLMFCDRSSN